MNSTLKPIASDASDRKFYRQISEDGKSRRVCMQYQKWEGGYGGDPRSWLEIHAALSAMNIPVPEIYKIDEVDCRIWIEDLGDHCLTEKLEIEPLDILNPKCADAIRYYKTALDLLVTAQYSQVTLSHPALNKFFDFEKLHYEMIFFVTHFLNGFLQLNVSQKTNSNLYNDFDLLCEKLDKCERVFCHRDYHVRNIMIKNDRMYWIDFQDARMGPHSYDVVSLLRDSYVDITWPTRKALMQYYLKALNQKRNELNVDAVSENQFATETLLMGLQRNVKAIGSFGYLATQKNKPEYLKYIFPTLNILCADEALAHADLNLGSSLPELFPSLCNLLFELHSGSLYQLLETKINSSFNHAIKS